MGNGVRQSDGHLQAEHAVLPGQGAVGDLAPVLPDQAVKGLHQAVAVRHVHRDLLGDLRIAAHPEPVQHQLDHHQYHSLHQAQPVHTRADGHAHGGGAPHTGGSGQAPDGAAVFEDDAGAQKGNAADHLGGNAGGVRPPGAGQSGSVDECVFGQDHEHRRGAGNDAVGPHPRLLLALGALQANGRAQGSGQQDPEQKFQVIV